MIYIAVLTSCLSCAGSSGAYESWLLLRGFFFGGPPARGTHLLVLPYGFSSMNSIALISIALFIMAGDHGKRPNWRETH